MSAAAAATAWHRYIAGPDGRCIARPLGAGRWPVCDQWPGNEVHIAVIRREPEWVRRARESRLPPKDYR